MKNNVLQTCKLILFSFYNSHQENRCYDIMLKIYEEIKNGVFQKKEISFKKYYSQLDLAKAHILKIKGFNTYYYFKLIEDYFYTIQDLEEEINRNNCNEVTNINSLICQIEFLKVLLNIRRSFLLEIQKNCNILEKELI